MFTTPATKRPYGSTLYVNRGPHKIKFPLYITDRTSAIVVLTARQLKYLGITGPGYGAGQGERPFVTSSLYPGRVNTGCTGL